MPLGYIPEPVRGVEPLGSPIPRERRPTPARPATVEPRGLEPRFLACNTRVLPLDDGPVRAGDGSRTHLIRITKAAPVRTSNTSDFEFTFWHLGRDSNPRKYG